MVDSTTLTLPAEVSSNVEQHLRREQQHNRLPRPRRHHHQRHEVQIDIGEEYCIDGDCDADMWDAF